ncbi:MAG: tetratricopeptide repeat protein [Candidatus Latescibacteria bacterium]|nr:tetratricopeptide repeat protein [Candidatus Latescibacterota bacterium]
MKSRLIVTALLAFIACAVAAGAQQAPPDTAEVILRDDMSDDEKIAALNRLLVLNPRNSELYNDLGVIYAGREDWVSARDAFIAAIQSDPRVPASHRNLGLVMTKLGVYDMALSELDAYRKLAPDGGGDAWKLIADARRRSGDSDGAAAAYESGLEAYGRVFGPDTCDLVMGRIALAEASSDQQAVDAMLDQYAGGARDLLAATGFEPADRTGMAARAVLDRALRRKLDVAQTAVREGRHADAAALFEAAMGLDPTRQDLLPQAAMAWFDSGDAMKAKVMARRATQDHPERPDGWRALGRVAEAENRTQDAIAAYTSAWNLDESQNDVAAKIGTLYLRAGDNEGARKFMGAVVSAPDTPAEILFNYGLSLQRSEDHKLAVPPLYKAVEKDPGLIVAWKALAASLRQLERWHEAADAYERALATERDPKLAFQLGTCLVKDGRPGDAIAAYRLALDLDPVYTKAWSNMGVVQMQIEDYVGALDTYRTLAALEDDVYRARLNEGVCLFHLGRYEEAIAAYEQALALQETSAVWENMGHVFDKLGDKQGAASCFKEGKRLKAEGK